MNWRHELDGMAKSDLVSVATDPVEREEVQRYAMRLWLWTVAKGVG